MPRGAVISATAERARDRRESVGAQPVPVLLPRCRRQEKSPALPRAGRCLTSCSQGPCFWELPFCSQVRVRREPLPHSAPAPRPAFCDAPSAMRILGGVSRAPDRPRRTPLGGWCRRAPASSPPRCPGQDRGKRPPICREQRNATFRGVVSLRFPSDVRREQRLGDAGVAEPTVPPLL